MDEEDLVSRPGRLAPAVGGELIFGGRPVGRLDEDLGHGAPDGGGIGDPAIVRRKDAPVGARLDHVRVLVGIRRRAPGALECRHPHLVGGMGEKQRLAITRPVRRQTGREVAVDPLLRPAAVGGSCVNALVGGAGRHESQPRAVARPDRAEVAARKGQARQTAAGELVGPDLVVGAPAAPDRKGDPAAVGREAREPVLPRRQRQLGHGALAVRQDQLAFHRCGGAGDESERAVNSRREVADPARRIARDLFRHRKRFADDLLAPDIEGHREQGPRSNVEQIPRRTIPTHASALEQDSDAPALAVEERDLSVIVVAGALFGADREDHLLAARQEVGPPVRALTLAGVDFRQRLELSSPGGNAGEPGRIVRREDDRVVVGPDRASLCVDAFADQLRRTSRDGRFLQLAPLGEEPDPLAVGRKERAPAARGAFDRTRFDLAERAQEEGPRAGPLGGIHQSPAVAG